MSDFPEPPGVPREKPQPPTSPEELADRLRENARVPGYVSVGSFAVALAAGLVAGFAYRHVGVDFRGGDTYKNFTNRDWIEATGVAAGALIVGAVAGAVSLIKRHYAGQIEATLPPQPI